MKINPEQYYPGLRAFLKKAGYVVSLHASRDDGKLMDDDDCACIVPLIAGWVTSAEERAQEALERKGKAS